MGFPLFVNSYHVFRHCFWGLTTNRVLFSLLLHFRFRLWFLLLYVHRAAWFARIIWYFLAVSALRLYLGHFSSTNHLGFYFSAWYWHFVDVIWLLLFTIMYC